MDLNLAEVLCFGKDFRVNRVNFIRMVSHYAKGELVDESESTDTFN